MLLCSGPMASIALRACCLPLLAHVPAHLASATLAFLLFLSGQFLPQGPVTGSPISDAPPPGDYMVNTFMSLRSHEAPPPWGRQSWYQSLSSIAFITSIPIRMEAPWWQGPTCLAAAQVLHVSGTQKALCCKTSNQPGAWVSLTRGCLATQSHFHY